MSSRGMRQVALAWLGSRLLIMASVLVVARIAGVGAERHPLAGGVWWLDRFAYWDSYHFVRIAESGYLPPGLACCDQAYFPGYPALMALLAPVTGGSTIAAGLVVTLVSGTVAAALLWQLVREDPDGGDAAARRSVVLLALAPCGFFLAAVYTEATFLAFAVGAWLAGSRRHWWMAGSLAALATAVRINGLFLTAGLVVMYLLQLRGDRRWFPRPSALALGLPALPVLAFFAYLRQRTGSWDAWREAEETGWDRSTVAPWEGLRVAWNSMTGTEDVLLTASRAGDIAAVLFGVAAVGLLAWRRRWPEVVFVGLSVGVVLCSTLWVSSARYALTWFPVVVALATLAEGRRGRLAVAACVTVAVPLLLLATYAAATRHWVA